MNMNEEGSETYYEFELPYGSITSFDDFSVVMDENFDLANTAYSLQLLNQMSAELYAGQSHYNYLVENIDLEIKHYKSSFTKKLRSTTKGKVFSLDRNNPLYDKIFTEKDVESFLYSSQEFVALLKKQNKLKYTLNRLRNSLNLIRNVYETVRSFHVDIRQDLNNGVV